jgi:hypothetical protein
MTDDELAKWMKDFRGSLDSMAESLRVIKGWATFLGILMIIQILLALFQVFFRK